MMPVAEVSLFVRAPKKVKVPWKYRSKTDRMRPTVKPANWTNPRVLPSEIDDSWAALAADCVWKNASKYERRVPYSVCVRMSKETAERLLNEKSEVSVRVCRPLVSPAPLEATPNMNGPPWFRLYPAWSFTKAPILMQVSVPGTYQKPAPYRLQTLTYSTGLAFTARSAACAPATATRPAADPRSRLLTIFILNLQFILLGGFRMSAPAPGKAPFSPLTSPSAPLHIPLNQKAFAVLWAQNHQMRRPGNAPLRRCEHSTARRPTDNEEHA